MIFLPDLLVDNQLINCWFSFKKIDSLVEKANSKRGSHCPVIYEPIIL